jgi:hypothetical protein
MWAAFLVHLYSIGLFVARISIFQVIFLVYNQE